MVGKIQKTFGAHGELLLAPVGDFSPSPGAPLFISIDGLLVPFYVKSAEEKGSRWVLTFDDVERESLAQELVGKEVMAELSAQPPRSRAATPLDEPVGYTVVDKALGELGVVSRRLDYPGNPCLQILNAAGQEILIPANGDLIASMDKQRKILTVNLPQGLVEIYLSEEA